MVNLSDVVMLELRPDCEDPDYKNLWVECSKQNNEQVSKTGISLVGCMWVEDLKEWIGERCLNTRRNKQEMAQGAFVDERK